MQCDTILYHHCDLICLSIRDPETGTLIEIKTKAVLTDVLTAIIFHASAFHAIENSAMDSKSFVPNKPEVKQQQTSTKTWPIPASAVGAPKLALAAYQERFVPSNF